MIQWQSAGVSMVEQMGGLMQHDEALVGDGDGIEQWG